MTCSRLGLALCRYRANSDITNPGVQNPHCEAWWSTIARCTGWRLPSEPDRLSTVTSSWPSIVGRKRIQELIARYSTRLPSALSSPNTTVHAPQSPSAQPSLVPVRCSTSRRYSSTVVVRDTFSAHTICPSRKKRMSLTLASPVNRVAPRRDQQGHVVVLFGMGDTDPDHGLLEKRRLRQHHAAGAKIGRNMECQGIAPGPKSRAGKQRRRGSA